MQGAGADGAPQVRRGSPALIDLSSFALPPDKDELRARLPLAFVCRELGIYLDANGLALCPFHPDTNESFHLWQGVSGERWGCWPCGESGDLYSLIIRLTACTFREAIERARELLAVLPHDFEAPRITPSRRSRPGDPITWYGEVNAALERAKERPWPQVFREWGVGIDLAGNLLQPHWAPDRTLTGCKVRGRGPHAGKKWSLDPSTYPHLYGSWRPVTSSHVLLCEGESDCISASEAAAREGILLDTLALPSGIRNPMPSWLDFLARWQYVLIAFDADNASLQKTLAWVDALGQRGIAVELPWDSDLRTVIESGTPLRQLLRLN